MAERSLFWDGTTADGGPYTQTHLHDWFFRSILNGTGNRGVLRGRWDELAVSGSTTPVNVASGAAILYGMYYENDTAGLVSIPTPAAGTRTDLIVVRRSWAAKTCRVTRIAGTAGGAAATMTQVAGETWDIPLASVEVTTGGVITITDTREYCEYSQALVDWSITSEDFFYPGAVTGAKIPNRGRWELKGAGQLDTESTGIYAAEFINAGGLYGAAYDHWRLASDVTDSLWAWFLVPENIEDGGLPSFYIWTAPDVNGLGAGAENVHWDYDIYYAADANIPILTTGTVLVDQQARQEPRIYCDTLALAVPVGDPPMAIGVRLTRAGAQANDTYKAPIRLLGIEMRWTAFS